VFYSTVFSKVRSLFENKRVLILFTQFICVFSTIIKVNTCHAILQRHVFGHWNGQHCAYSNAEFERVYYETNM